MSTFPSRSPFRRLTRSLALALLSLGGLVAAQAQVAVSGVTYGPAIDGPNVTVRTPSGDRLTYENIYSPLSTVTAGGQIYNLSSPSSAQSVVLRRSNAYSNYGSEYYLKEDSSYSGKGTGVYAPAPNNPESVLLSSNVYYGVANPFANGNGAGNVERIDVNLGGHVVQAGDSIVLFDVEDLGNLGDSFRVAAFTGWVGNAPQAYVGTGIKVPADSFGGPLTYPNGQQQVTDISATYNSSGTLTGMSDLGPGVMVGLLIKLTDLGVTVGQTIQGISFLSSDVVVNSASDLLDWTKYPTNTTGADAQIDFMGFTGAIARPIPEPATYGAIFVAGVLGLVLWNRRAKPVPVRVPRA